MSFFIDDKYPEVDRLYRDIRDNLERKKEKAFIEKMWALFEPFADKKFRKRAQTQFIACAWEMYLAYCISQNGFELQERSSEDPDVCAVKDGQRYWFEAVAPDLGTGPDAVPPISLRGKARNVPAREIMLRYTSVINSKINQVQRKFGNGVIAQNDFVLVAICSHLISMDYGFFSLEHYLGRVLYGIGDAYVEWDKQSGQVSGLKYNRQDYIKKISGAGVRKDVFFWTENGIVSGVLFSHSLNFHKPTSGKEFIIFPNLFPKNNLPKDVFTFCNKGSVVEESDLFSLHFLGQNPLHLA